MQLGVQQVAASAGWIGSALIATCLVPQVLKLRTTRSGRDLSYATLLVQLAGNGCFLFFASVHGIVQMIFTNSFVILCLLLILAQKAAYARVGPVGPATRPSAYESDSARLTRLSSTRDGL